MSGFKYFEFRPHGGVYFDKENADIMFQYMDALENKIKELQELLIDFRNDMWNNGEWTESFDKRMRELGIEVE